MASSRAVGPARTRFCLPNVATRSLNSSARLSLQYLGTSGGIFEGASDPPAFVHNLRRELKQQLAAETEQVRGHVTWLLPKT